MERDIRVGMTVRSSDGEKLGKVIRCGEDEFVIERGYFFPKDYVARYDEARASGGEVLLSSPASSLRKVGDRGAEDVRPRETRASGLGTEIGTYAIDASGRPGEGGDRRAGGDVRSEDAKSEEEAEVRRGAIGEPED